MSTFYNHDQTNIIATHSRERLNLNNIYFYFITFKWYDYLYTKTDLYIHKHDLFDGHVIFETTTVTVANQT